MNHVHAALKVVVPGMSDAATATSVGRASGGSNAGAVLFKCRLLFCTDAHLLAALHPNTTREHDHANGNANRLAKL